LFIPDPRSGSWFFTRPGSGSAKLLTWRPHGTARPGSTEASASFPLPLRFLPPPSFGVHSPSGTLSQIVKGCTVWMNLALLIVDNFQRSTTKHISITVKFTVNKSASQVLSLEWPN
jgi:hypothetical protein